MVAEDDGWWIPNPGRARGGVMASPWDRRQPLAAQARLRSATRPGKNGQPLLRYEVDLPTVERRLMIWFEQAFQTPTEVKTQAWPAIREQYRPLLEHVAHRSDLTYVLSEMIAELNASHTYVTGGDYEIPPRPKAALLGAKLELDPEAGRYRVARIYPGHNEEPNYRSPLTEVGVDIAAGDYVLAIDGRDLAGSDNPYRLLQHLEDSVTLTVNSTPSLEGSREVTYVPRGSESPLLYLDWVLGNLDRVTEMTDGRVGYLHIPDMFFDGIAEFIKWYYPQIRKEGMVVDVRSNGGGNISQWIIERLDTRMLGTGQIAISSDATLSPAPRWQIHHTPAKAVSRTVERPATSSSAVTSPGPSNSLSCARSASVSGRLRRSMAPLRPFSDSASSSRPTSASTE